MASVRELSELAVDVTSPESEPVVRVRGDVDLDTAPLLERRLNGLVDDGAREIVVDFGELTFMDMAGLTVLVRVLKRLRARDGRIRLRSASPSVQKVFEITGLDGVLPAG